MSLLRSKYSEREHSISVSYLLRGILLMFFHNTQTNNILISVLYLICVKIIDGVETLTLRVKTRL